jgi:hypothetical protein
VIARLDDAAYGGHGYDLEGIATGCGVAPKLHAERKPGFDLEVLGYATEATLSAKFLKCRTSSDLAIGAI